MMKQVPRLRRGTMLRDIGWGGANDTAAGYKLSNHNIAIVRPVDLQGDVKVVAQYVHAPVGQHQFNADMRILMGEIRNQRRESLAPDLVGRTNPNMSERRRAASAYLRLELVQLGEDSKTTLVKEAPLLR